MKINCARLIYTLILFGCPASFAYDECGIAKSAVISCISEKPFEHGHDLKQLCAKEIKTFIFQYEINRCKAFRIESYSQDLGTQMHKQRVEIQVPLETATQELINSGRLLGQIKLRRQQLDLRIEEQFKSLKLK